MDFLSIPTALAASITESGNTAASETTSGLSEFFNTIWNQAPSWIAAMIVFACTFLIAKITKEKVLDRVSKKISEDDQDVLVLIGRATYMGVLVVGITISLKIGGIDLTPIVAAAGFGLGFAMQDFIMNFLAGVFILLNRQFTLGDFIKVNETIGQVMEIQSRATILKALDGTRVIVPNSDLFTKEVVSYTSNPFRRLEVPVGVEYRTDLAHAQQAILEALQESEEVLSEPRPAIVLDEFDDSSINFLVRFWVDSKSHWINTRSDVIHLIKKRLDAEGIGIPFPIRTLVMDKDTEGVNMPVYQVSGEEMTAQRSKREQEEVALAERISAAASRAQKIQDIQPPAPTEPTPAVVPAPVAPEAPAAEAPAIPEVSADDEAAATPGGPDQIIEEDVAEVAEAVQAVQAEQEATAPITPAPSTLTPATVPVPDAEKAETGAAFLQQDEE